jgi:hypothetical protein
MNNFVDKYLFQATIRFLFWLVIGYILAHVFNSSWYCCFLGLIPFIIIEYFHYSELKKQRNYSFKRRAVGK